MRKVLVAVLVILGVAAAFGVIGMIASESGEVVVLRTTDASGAAHETRLWVVEHDGDWWLRAGSPDNAWLARLRERPEIEVERDGEARVWRAVPTPEARDAVNALMREKYGLADRWIDWTFGREDAVPVRLEPRASR